MHSMLEAVVRSSCTVNLIVLILPLYGEPIRLPRHCAVPELADPVQRVAGNSFRVAPSAERELYWQRLRGALPENGQGAEGEADEK
jgi:hypothetical protein